MNCFSNLCFISFCIYGTSLILNIYVWHSSCWLQPLNLSLPFLQNSIQLPAYLVSLLFCFYMSFSIENPVIAGSLFIMCLFGTPLSIIDSLHYVLPNKIVYLFIVTSFFYILLYAPHLLLGHFIASLIILIGLFSLSLLLPKSLGGGDIKLIFGLTLLLGFNGSIEALFFASLLGMCQILFTKSYYIAFGPYLLIGGYLALIL